MQEARQAWDDLVEQVRDGARADEVLGLQEPREKLSSEEFWKRLEVRGIGDKTLCFLPPDVGELLEAVAGTIPKEELVVLPPCLCLDSVLQPEFVMPPAQLFQEYRMQREGEKEAAQVEAGRGKKRRRDNSMDLAESPTASELHSTPAAADVIDLTQDS